MKNGVRTGIFLCQCGRQIADRVDLAALESRLEGTEGVVSIQSHPRYCISSGLAELKEAVQKQNLNRVLLGACSDRIMKKKFSRALEDSGFLESQIELTNLRDHVALAHKEPKAELTLKAAALLSGGAASLRLLEPTPPIRVDLSGPALILGGGISGFEAARELAHFKMESVLFSEFHTPDEVLGKLPRAYPGSRLYRADLKSLLNEVFSNPLVTIVQDCPPAYLNGRVGNYSLGLEQPDGSVREIGGSAIIFALDREFVEGEKLVPGGGGRVIDQIEFEDRLARGNVEPCKTVFWVNGDGGTTARKLSALSAWRNCQYLIDKYPKVTPAMLYPSDIRPPLTGAELRAAANQGIEFHEYKPALHPVVQSQRLTYISSRDQMDHEIPWETLVLSAVPGPLSAKALGLSRYVRIFANDTGLKEPPLKVKPEQEPVKWPFLTGSAHEACDLNEALQQGKRAAREVIRLRERAQNGGLASPLIVVSVDKDLCDGCGLCSEICTCGGVENEKPVPGRIIRKVDPHTCDGGGSCAAACPYEAMKVLNNSTQQLEARVRTVVSHMKETDVLGFACSWGGQGAAELAAIRKLTYPSRVFILPVRCLGTIDPTILTMAFLNGASFIMLAGCTPTSSCHYGHGVDHTWSRVSLVKKLLTLSGLERQRIALGYVDVNEPEAFVRMVNSFLGEADRMGPVDRTEAMRKRLFAAHTTLHRPRVRWVLGAGLRRPSEGEFPESQINPIEFDETVQDVIDEEYLAARIIGALREAELDPPQIAEALNERTVKVSSILDELRKDGRIVVSQRRRRYPVYALAKSL